jgi:tetratricopeptide (TPR) repeat protein
LIGLGEAERQIGNPGYRRTLLDASGLARALGDPDRLCRAVLANSRGLFAQTGAVDCERVRALEAAAEALPGDDARRARVLAVLACELHHGSEPERCRALAAEAIEIARTAGDQGTLAYTLESAFVAIWMPDTLEERQRLVEERIELTQRLADPRLSFGVALGSMMVGMEVGDRSRVESALTTIRTVAASVPEPTLIWLALAYESGWAFVQGDLQAAEQLALEGFEAGTASGQPDAVVVFGGLLFNIRYQQGRLGELVEGLVRLAGKPDSLAVLRASAALALIESDRADEARELALVEDFQSVPWDLIWPQAMFIWADACSRLGLGDRAGELYELLGPFSGQLAVSGTTLSGSIDWALGRLATTLQQYEHAEDHFAAAAQIDERLGAPLFLARTYADWARELIARGRPEDLDSAPAMLEQAEEGAERLEADGIARGVAECRTALAAISG